MNTEEKAKRYDEALERAKKQRADYQKELDKTDKDSQLAGLLRAGISAIELAFPELSESEDERIRKELIEFLRKAYSKGNAPEEYSKWLVWLDQPKEQKPVEWSEEDETIIDCAVEVVEKAGLPSIAASLKSLLERFNEK